MSNISFIMALWNSKEISNSFLSIELASASVKDQIPKKNTKDHLPIHRVVHDVGVEEAAAVHVAFDLQIFESLNSRHKFSKNENFDFFVQHREIVGNSGANSKSN